MKAKCPRCERETDITGNPFRPFCSERCKLIDLGNWLDGAYTVPTDREAAADETQEPGKASENP